MDILRRILTINAYIQRKLGTITFNGKPVLAVALDGTCAFDDAEGTELALSDTEIDDLYRQTWKNAAVADSRILGRRWWHTPRGTIGIVAVQTFADQWKAYMGIVGSEEPDASDEAWLAAHGDGLRDYEAVGFFPSLNIDQYKKDGV